MDMEKILCRSAQPQIYYLIEEENGLFLRTVTTENPADAICCYIIDSGTEEKTTSWRVSSELPFHVEWILPGREGSGNPGCEKSNISGRKEDTGSLTGAVLVITGECLRIDQYQSVPHCNILGETVSLDIPNGRVLEETAFQFYWRTLIPSVIERTKAADYPVRDGYVVSTLQEEVYAGTYPDVDHEFQIKGRIGMMDRFDLEVVRRMLELQIRLMSEDPEHRWRNPCSLQPGGQREYKVRRSSMDGSANAEMFLLTGNVEIIESVWLYLAASKDWGWLNAHKKDLENVLSLVEACMDDQGRLWSDVYYEDQVIKDGRECITAAFAAQAMRVMADLERRAGDEKNEKKYLRLSRRLAQTLVQDSPIGFWDKDRERFTDWVDRNSVVHDHIHLLANELPILFGFADQEQEKAVAQLLQTEFEEFQRFPSFVSARVQDYTEDEIGDGGPYDLCAAGRYWCWDFAYWAGQSDTEILEAQLAKVCEQAQRDDYLMGERYDMNHVYYIDDKNWHGAERYYEYPCVFLWNLFHTYLGIRPDMDCDLRVEPLLRKDGKVSLYGENQKIEYTICGGNLSVKNLAERGRSICVCWNGTEKTFFMQPNETVSVSAM